MSLLKHSAVQWLLAVAIVLGFTWATGTKVFAPRPSAGRIVPDAVLDGSFVLPPNDTDFGVTPREPIALFAKRGITTRRERHGPNYSILRFGGENRLTGAPLDAAFQLRSVTGPHEVVSQVIGFTGPAVVVEAMAEDGIAAHWAITTRLFEGLQSALAQEPGSRRHTLVQARQPPLSTENRSTGTASAVPPPVARRCWRRRSLVDGLAGVADHPSAAFGGRQTWTGSSGSPAFTRPRMPRSRRGCRCATVASSGPAPAMPTPSAR